ncbi:MAG: hypothetical protein MN733_08380 [Nitrososphaera sp.]|nr:hypothetical protein [Nitrososphaera sp.]
MTNILPLFIVIILLTSGLTACSRHSGNIRATDRSMIDKIQIGTTTKDEVRRLMGDPSSIQRGSLIGAIQRGHLTGDPSSIQTDGSSETWTYRYTQTNIGAKAFIPFANLVGESPVDVNINLLMITFNAKGIVENVMSRIDGDK